MRPFLTILLVISSIAILDGVHISIDFGNPLLLSERIIDTSPITVCVFPVPGYVNILLALE
jgi:hypothetical protein